MEMIVELLVAGSTLLGCVGCWAAVQKHRITAELQKHKLNVDLEVIKPPPEPTPPAPPVERPGPAQQSLSELLNRRKMLEAHINTLRDRASEYRFADKSYAVYREDTLKALEDARAEQKELVIEEAALLEMMQGSNHGTAQKPVRIDPGGPVAQRMADPGELHDAELHDEEASREDPAGVHEEVAGASRLPGC